MFPRSRALFVVLQCTAVLACASLPLYQSVNGMTFHLRRMTECKGGKVFEIQNVQDYDQCRLACEERQCMAVNVFQVGEYDFVCEILRNVEGMVYAQGASCYTPF